jgi:hypothetical protein
LLRIEIACLVDGEGNFLCSVGKAVGNDVGSEDVDDNEFEGANVATVFVGKAVGS